MKISFRCSECDGALTVSAEMAGKRGKCPRCQAVVVVPAAPAKPRSAEKQDEIEDYDPGDAYEVYEEDDDDQPPRLPAPRRSSPVEMRRCPMCGARNSKSSRTCRACGEELTSRKSSGPTPWGKPLLISEALQTGWEAFQGSAGPLIGATVILGGVTWALNFASRFAIGMVGLAGEGNQISVGIMVAVQMTIQLSISLIRGYFSLGIANMSIKAVRGGADFEDLFVAPVIALRCLVAGCAYYFVPFVLATVMLFYLLKRILDVAALGGDEEAVGMAVINIMIELLVFMIAGGIVTWAVAFIFWAHSYLLLEEKETIVGSFSRAMQMSLPNLHKMLGLWLIVGLVYLGGVLMCCIGLIVMYPLGQCMLAASYVQMCGKSRD